MSLPSLNDPKKQQMVLYQPQMYSWLRRPAILTLLVIALPILTIIFLARWGLRLRRLACSAIAADEMFFVSVPDWQLAVRRYKPALNALNRLQQPVLLVHGYGSNGLHYDTPQAKSMARWLADQGADVFVVDLRAAGDSRFTPTSRSASRWDYDLDDMIADVGIVARFIAERSRSETVHLIGHSMGGMIAVATACKLPSLYQSVCILGSTMCYYKSSSVWAGLIPILAYAKLLSLNRLPIAAVSTLVSGLTGRAFSGPIDRFLVNPHNVHPPALRLLFAGGFNPVSMRLSEQLQTGFYSQGLTDRSHRPYMPQLGSITAPCLCLVGDRDAQCPPPAAKVLFDALPSTIPKVFRVVGKEAGHAHSYGHCDILCGMNADKEVFPLIWNWIATYDTKLAPV